MNTLTKKRLVVECPRSAKEAWDLITDIVKDNKRSRTIALKTELRSIKLGDLSMDAYFRKIESISTILTSLSSPVSSEDVVTFSLEGLLDKYVVLCTIRTPFPDLKMACSMLTTEEMRLKSKSLSLPVDSPSSFLMVLMVETWITRRPSTPHVKSWRSCYNFARGSCHFRNECKFVHDENAKSNGNKTINGINLDKLLTKLLRQLGLTTIWLQKILLDPLARPYLLDIYFGPTCLLAVSGYSPPGSIKAHEKPPVLLCHACQLGKHVRLPFASSDTVKRLRLWLIGGTQLKGIDIDENFSPVVKSSTIQTVMSLAISRHWLIHQLDVKNDFLHGDLSKTDYMH
ncbi:hybrid signal transduction histidine kinase M [Tanacetum coccineum]